MSTKEQADWILDFSLRIAVIICLSTLAVGVLSGADPLMALMRSGIAFVSFLTLGWAASLLWNVPKAQRVEASTDPTDGDDRPDATASPSATQPASNTES